MSSQEVHARVPLNNDMREIRILALAPGTSDDALRGDLFVESLNYDDLHYTALSYTWSGPVTRSAIIISGIPLLITENLELALRRIRGPSRPKNLWVDAICINQNDPEEKSVQVSLMGGIYSNATRTTVWLGESSAESDLAMDFIHSLQNEIHDFDTKDDQVLTRAIVELMGREWWTRVWVIQEALLSRRVNFMCGNKEVDLPKKPQLLAKRSFEDTTPKEEFEHPKQLSEQPFIEILTNWYSYKQQVETSGLNLMDLTLLTHGFKASVQRDKIFALLALTTSEARSSIIPDNSAALSHRLLLTRITGYFLQFSWKPLQIACHCPAGGCLSWVPDWTAIDDELFKAVKNDFKISHSDESSDDHKIYQLPIPTLPTYPRFSKTARFHAQLEPSLQGLQRYQEPSALLVYGWTIDRMKIVSQIPNALDVSGSCSKGTAVSMKAKIQEWESLVSQHFQRPWYMFMTDWRSDFKSRASVIDYLVSLPSARWDDLSVLKRATAGEAERRVYHYEKWVHWTDQKGCDSCNNNHFNPCSACSRPEWRRGPNRLGQEIIASNAGKTLVLTDSRKIHRTDFAVNEGEFVRWGLAPIYSYYVRPETYTGRWLVISLMRIIMVFPTDVNSTCFRFGKQKLSD